MICLLVHISKESMCTKEASKPSSSITKHSQHVLLKIRAIQGHTGGNVIAPELMGHVAIPFKWKEFLFHRGCSYDVTSILR